MFCQHVFGNIFGGFRGISRFFGNFAGFRGKTWISRVHDRAKYQKPCCIYKLYPEQQATRSHEILKIFAWCGYKLTTLCVQDFVEWAITLLLFFDMCTKTWQAEQFAVSYILRCCYYIHDCIKIFPYMYLVHDKVENIQCNSGRA